MVGWGVREPVVEVRQGDVPDHLDHRGGDVQVGSLAGLPYRDNNADAVFSPIPATPGRPSLGSPRRAARSA